MSDLSHSKLWRAVKRRDGQVCQYCGTSDPHKAYEIDHVIPQKLGGPSELYNLVVACLTCNARKGHWRVIIPANLDTITAEYPEWRGRIREIVTHPELCRQPKPQGAKAISITVPMPVDLLARLDAQRGKLARVEVIRQAIEEYIARRQEGNK